MKGNGGIRIRYVFWPVVAVLLFLAVTALIRRNPPAVEAVFDSSPPAEAGGDSHPRATAPDPDVIVRENVAPGESFYDILKSREVSDADILELASTARGAYNLKKIRTGHSYGLIMDGDGRPARFEYDIGPSERLVLERGDGAWSAEIVPLEYQITEDIVQGVIKDSLYLSLVDGCGDPVLAVDLADIFGWDIDFALDLRDGDRYGILFEKKWRDGVFMGTGRVLAARFVNQGEPYDAVYDETEGAYFDSEGRSLQKQFLKSPLRFKYISSRFSRSRLHPILKIRRPHLGVDYAAPYGTPVRASADGRITAVGRKGGLGNRVKIRHNATYSTLYGHLSRYAKGIRRNKAVQQGDIIGYVGSTGISTGPHLHYSFYRNGQLIDPLKIKNPRTSGIPRAEKEDFLKRARRLLERVDPPAYEPLTAVVGAGNG